MSRYDPGSLGERLLRLCLVLLVCAVAVHWAVRLIESVAGTLLFIAAVVGGVVVLGGIARLIWRRYSANRW